MINMTKKFIKRLARDEKGLTAVEYAVLGGVIVAGILALQTSFNNGLRDAFAALFGPCTGRLDRHSSSPLLLMRFTARMLE